MAKVISTTSEYALRAVIHLAKNQGEKQTVKQISAETQVPEKYLAKVMQSLVRARIVGSFRGKGGGFSLLSEPKDIPLLEVIEAVDPLERIDRCPLGLEEHAEHKCKLHSNLNEIHDKIVATFRNSTVADYIND